MKRSKSQFVTVCAQSILFFFILTAFFQSVSFGESGAASKGREVKYLSVNVGKSVVVNSSQPVTRVSIADPKTADFVLISPNEIYITGKATGATNMTLWSDNTVVAIYNLSITHDVAQLKSNLNSVMPDEKDVKVFASGDSITLSGKMSNSSNLAQALALAQSYVVDKGTVQNLLEVAGNHQVMLEVRVAEMSRTLGRHLGINIHYNTNGNDFGVGMLGQLTQLVLPGSGQLLSGNAINANEAINNKLSIGVSPNVNAMFRFRKGNSSWTGFIDALRDDGLIKILAEPNLIALSGQDASFLAGGEFPVPVPQGLGTTAIEWKEYGVRLMFKPVVLGNKINITVAPEVSDLDFSAGFESQGFIVPALRTRKARTVVELSDGQSFAIAGLLSSTVRDAAAKYPLLGSIPVLGQLFSSRQFQRDETELVIFVTPHFVKPVDQQKQPLPTDSYKEPDDLDFYLLGNMESRSNAKPMVKGELDGEYGHAVPPAEGVKQ